MRPRAEWLISPAVLYGRRKITILSRQVSRDRALIMLAVSKATEQSPLVNYQPMKRTIISTITLLAVAGFLTSCETKKESMTTSETSASTRATTGATEGSMTSAKKNQAATSKTTTKKKSTTMKKKSSSTNAEASPSATPSPTATP